MIGVIGVRQVLLFLAVSSTLIFSGPLPAAATTCQLLTSWGGSGTSAGKFLTDVGAIAAADSGSVFAIDPGNYRIQKFASDGAHITSWGSFGSADGQFRTPGLIVVDPAGDILVVDNGQTTHPFGGGRGVIYKFSEAGVFLRKWGNRGPFHGVDQGAFGIDTFVRTTSEGPPTPMFYTVTSSDFILQFYNHPGPASSSIASGLSPFFVHKGDTYPNGLGWAADGTVFVSATVLRSSTADPITTQLWTFNQSLGDATLVGAWSLPDVYKRVVASFGNTVLLQNSAVTGSLSSTLDQVASTGVLRHIEVPKTINWGSVAVDSAGFIYVGVGPIVEKYDCGLGTQPAACGNGIIDDGEECDDGNSIPSDGCTADCGVETGWTCSGAPSSCYRSCGNGAPETGEQCDDAGANGTSSSCCAITCTFQPGGTPCAFGTCNGSGDCRPSAPPEKPKMVQPLNGEWVALDDVALRGRPSHDPDGDQRTYRFTAAKISRKRAIRYAQRSWKLKTWDCSDPRSVKPPAWQSEWIPSDAEPLPGHFATGYVEATIPHLDEGEYCLWVTVSDGVHERTSDPVLIKTHHRAVSSIASFIFSESPGFGSVYGGWFIPKRKLGINPGGSGPENLAASLLGDDRGFSPDANPMQYRVYFNLDFESGVGYIQATPSCMWIRFFGDTCRSARDVDQLTAAEFDELARDNFADYAGNAISIGNFTSDYPTFQVDAIRIRGSFKESIIPEGSPMDKNFPRIDSELYVYPASYLWSRDADNLCATTRDAFPAFELWHRWPDGSLDTAAATIEAVPLKNALCALSGTWHNINDDGTFFNTCHDVGETTTAPDVTCTSN